MFLGILIVLLFSLFYFNKEGLDVNCKYQYLSPNQQNTPLDDATINKFIFIFNINMNNLGVNQKATRAIYDFWISQKIICTEEVNYYIQNKSFPVNQYLSGALKTYTRIKIPPPFIASTISFAYSGRAIFSSLVIPALAGTNIYIQDYVDAKAIYDGTNPEPSCVDATPPPEPPPEPPPSSPEIDACMSTCNDACQADSSLFSK